MYRTKLTTIAAALSLLACPAAALAAGTGDNHPTSPPAGAGSKAKAYGTYCKDESKTHVDGQSGTPFSQCVAAMAKLAAGTSGNPTSACEGLSKKHVAGQPGTPFSQCVKAAAKLKKAQAATSPTTTDPATAPDPSAARATSQPADVVVCNEAQNSPRGTMDATASTDPLPPARHKSTAMPVGHGNGLINAAANSPALAVCVPQTPPDGGGDGGGGGGGTS